MKETIEHNNRFYTNEKGEIKTENELLKEWLIIANKETERLNNRVSELEKAVSRKEEQITDLDDENFDLENEIERLKDLCNKYEEEHKTTFEEWKKAINIIKEVREKINKDYWWNWDTDNDKIIREILEIIDKVEGKNEI